MNKVQLTGRLTKDPSVTYTRDKNMAIARFTLAVNRRKKAADGSNEADFIPCIMFDKGAEHAEKYYKQGTAIAIVGRIQTGSYTDREGKTVFTTEVVVEESEFAGTNPNRSEQMVQQSAPAQQPLRQATQGSQVSQKPAPEPETANGGAFFGDGLPWN